MGPPQGSVEVKENLPHPAGHTLLDAPQDSIGFLGKIACCHSKNTSPRISKLCLQKTPFLQRQLELLVSLHAESQQETQWLRAKLIFSVFFLCWLCLKKGTWQQAWLTALYFSTRGTVSKWVMTQKSLTPCPWIFSPQTLLQTQLTRVRESTAQPASLTPGTAWWRQPAPRTSHSTGQRDLQFHQDQKGRKTLKTDFLAVH